MIAIIIGTHGNFSKELVKSAEMIFGSQSNIGYITFKPGEGVEDLISKYKAEIEKLDCSDGVLFMVDLFGGSPFNAASILAIQNDNYEIITGINLPMLLEVFGLRNSCTLKELLETAKNAGNESIKTLNKEKNHDLEEDDL